MKLAEFWKLSECIDNAINETIDDSISRVIRLADYGTAKCARCSEPIDKRGRHHHEDGRLKPCPAMMR